MEFENTGEFIDNLRIKTAKLLSESKEYIKAFEAQDKEKYDEVDNVMKSAGTAIMSTISTDNPMLMLVVDDVIGMVSVMFWMGHYLGSTPKTEVPDVFKKYMEEKNNG